MSKKDESFHLPPNNLESKLSALSGFAPGQRGGQMTIRTPRSGDAHPFPRGSGTSGSLGASVPGNLQEQPGSLNERVGPPRSPSVFSLTRQAWKPESFCSMEKKNKKACHWLLGMRMSAREPLDSTPRPCPPVTAGPGNRASGARGFSKVPAEHTALWGQLQHRPLRAS